MDRFQGLLTEIYFSIRYWVGYTEVLCRNSCLCWKVTQGIGLEHL